MDEELKPAPTPTPAPAKGDPSWLLWALSKLGDEEVPGPGGQPGNRLLDEADLSPSFHA